MQPSLPFSLSVQYGLFIFRCMVDCHPSGRKNADVRDVCKKIYMFLFNARTTCQQLKLRLKKNADFALLFIT